MHALLPRDRSPDAPGSVPTRRSPAKATRSAVSNGRKPFAGADNRSAEARRLRDVRRDLEAALGHLATPGETLLIHRAATLTVTAEKLDSAIARGEAGDCDAVVRVANALTRTLTALGMVQWAEPVPPEPSLADHLAARAAEQDQEPSE